MRLLKSLSALVVAAALAAPALAQPVETAAPAATNGKKVETMMLTLPLYLGRVVKGARDMKLARYDVDVAAANYHEYRDGFSPMLSAGGSYALPGSSNLNITAASWNVGISKVFSETGTVLSLGLNNTYSYQSVLNNVSTFALGALGTMKITNAISNNSWKVAASATLSQSLLRGGPIGLMGVAQMDIMKNLVKMQRSVYNSRTSGVILQALATYWTYELNEKLLTLAEESIRDARDLLERNRRRVAVGTVEIVDIYSAEVNLTTALNSRDLIQRDLLNGRAQMLYLMGVTNKLPDEIDIVFVEPLQFQEVDTDEDKILVNAERSRKELEQARIQLDMARLNLRMAKAALLPKLDASVTVGLTGLDSGNGSIQDAYGNLSASGKTNAVDLALGLKFETPLDPGAYATVVEKRNAEYQKAIDNVSQLKDQLRTQVRSHLANLGYLREVLSRSKEALDLSDRKVAELRRQFNNGKINSDRYLRGYDDQRIVQRTYFSTLLQYEIEKNSLLLTQGLFLKTYGVSELDVAAVVR